MRFTFLSLGILPAVLLVTNPFDLALQHVDAIFGTASEAVKEADLDPRTKGSVSNVLKTKHDTVKNSINNVR